jgi:phosphate uptake regulator
MQEELLNAEEQLTKMVRIGKKQLYDSILAFKDLNIPLSDEIIDKDNIIDNINLGIEEKCFELFNQTKGPEQRFFRAVVRVSSNLERACDAACHIARRVRLSHKEGIEQADFDLGEMLPVAVAALEEATEAFMKRSVELAEKACVREIHLDEMYVRKLEILKLRMVAEPERIPSFLNWFSVIKYLEKVGDYALNIGEQAIFLATGKRIKFYQYKQLDQLSSNSTQLHSFSDGISGAMVGFLEDDDHKLIYKEGNIRKIEEEAEKLKEWQGVSPEISPKLISTSNYGDRKALLREFVQGNLLSELLYSERDVEEKVRVTEQVFQTLIGVWKKTLRKVTPQMDYVNQVVTRLPESYAMHPYLEFIANQKKLNKMLGQARRIEQGLAPNFSVWLHGDFNINNLIYNKGELKIIDVHRSKFGDNLADLGTFLVSTQRQPGFKPKIKEDMRKVRETAVKEVRVFAEENGDEFFVSRLDLVLARHYLTSARVIVNEDQARWLFTKGLNKLKRVVKN